MNTNILVALCCVAVYNGCLAKPATDEEIKDLPTYMKRFEKVNVEQVLNNDRVLTSHLKCFLNEGPCVQQSRDLKSEYLFIRFLRGWSTIRKTTFKRERRGTRFYEVRGVLKVILFYINVIYGMYGDLNAACSECRSGTITPSYLNY